MVRAICVWMASHARDLPWRREHKGRRDPYASLVSEFMLQQTQVSRVLEKFGSFLGTFPSAAALAAAPEQDVLAAWSGLGYYRRARLLHRAAKEIVARFGGKVPSEPDELGTLPGVGRYTAGAIASIVFGRAVPIVDGNVARVLLRVSARQGRTGDAGTQRWAWERAEHLVGACDARHTPSLFNEGLMELGATVCLPAAPRCERCPVSGSCRARALGLQDEIPAPRIAARRTTVWCSVLIVRDEAGRVLVERRPDRAMFAGMHQAPTRESAAREPLAMLRAWAGAPSLARVGRFEHATTHRLLKVEVFESPAPGPACGAERVWVGAHDLPRLALSNLQRRVLTEAFASTGKSPQGNGALSATNGAGVH